MTVSLQLAPFRIKTSCTTLKTKFSSGMEQTSLAFRKDVHFFCSVRSPPRSPCVDEKLVTALGKKDVRAEAKGE